MFPVSFRPHRMRIIHRGAGSYASNGDWSESDPRNCKCIPCRYEPNGRANTIPLPDGTAYKYSYMVYLNVNPCLPIGYGDVIELFSQDGKSMGEYEVKGFHRGQLNMKVWV